MTLQPIIDALARDFVTTQPWEGPTALGFCLFILTAAIAACMIIITCAMCRTTDKKGTTRQEETE